MFVREFVRRHRAAGAATGLAAMISASTYCEYSRIQKRLNSLISPFILNLDTKHPDYIYVKYHIYKESMRQQRHEELENEKWINVVVHPIGNWWKSVKHSIAWRLLEVAKHGGYRDRIKAVHQLARIDHLKDWDYQHLAQMCDTRTAISLARHFADVRWFLPPANFGALRSAKSLIAEIREHLERLKPCPCVHKFNATIFDNFGILKGYTMDTTKTAAGVKVTRQEYDFLRKCLEAIYHLTQDADVADALLRQGFLQTLMETMKLFHDDVDLRFLLVKIVANLTVCGAAADFFMTGWVGVLARWTRHPDIRVQVTAAKALANIDVDDPHRCEYRAKVFPLYPLIRTQRKPQLDVVFIHGLLGGVFVTWRQKDPQGSDLGLYAKRRRPNIATNRTVLNSVWTQEIKTITYSEEPLVSRKPVIEKPVDIADKATKEFVESLEADETLPRDWEAVFPDCPLSAVENDKGIYSIAGDKWIHTNTSEEYTFCWPMDWLPQEFPNIRVIGLNYETSISEWSLNVLCECEKTKSSLHIRSEELLDALAASNVGRDVPVIWIGHSMGGLVAKSILVQALASADPAKRTIAENTRAIMFLGTPHRGSPVAKLKQHVQMIFSPTIEVKELREDSQPLQRLHTGFVEALQQLPKPIAVVSIAEGNPTNITAFKFPMHFVTEASAKLDFGEFYVLNVDHLGLSKPMYQQSFMYRRLLTIMRAVLEDERCEAADATAATNAARKSDAFAELSARNESII